jgi:hypothetical protein
MMVMRHWLKDQGFSRSYAEDCAAVEYLKRSTQDAQLLSKATALVSATMVTLKGHKRCDHQDPENPELRCYRQPSFNFFGSVGGVFCHQHKVRKPSCTRCAFVSLNFVVCAAARHGQRREQVL